MAEQSTQPWPPAATPAAGPPRPTLLGLDMVPCRADGCGRSVVFARSVKTDKLVPLDAAAQVAAVFDRRDGQVCCHGLADYWWTLCQLGSRGRMDEVFQGMLAVRGFGLNHFQNCRRPQDFSGSGAVVADHRRRMRDTLLRLAVRLDGPGRSVGPADAKEMAALCRAAADNTPEAPAGR